MFETQVRLIRNEARSPEKSWLQCLAYNSQLFWVTKESSEVSQICIRGQRDAVDTAARRGRIIQGTLGRCEKGQLVYHKELEAETSARHTREATRLNKPEKVEGEGRRLFFVVGEKRRRWKTNWYISALAKYRTHNPHINRKLYTSF